MRCYTALVLVGLLDILTGVHGAANIAVGTACPSGSDTCVTTATCQTTCKLNVAQACVTTDSPTKCVDHATCTATTAPAGTCTCEAGYSGTPTCTIKAGYLTGTCADTAACTTNDANSQCTGSRCECKTGYSANGIVCVADGQLNGACKASSVCDAANTQCTSSKCVCKTGYAEVSGQCSGAVNVIASLVLIFVSVATSRFL